MKKTMRFSFATKAERDAAYNVVSNLVEGSHMISTYDTSSAEFLLFVESTKSPDKDIKISAAAEACRC